MAITTKGVLDWILYEKGGSYNCRLIEFIKQLIKQINYFFMLTIIIV